MQSSNRPGKRFWLLNDASQPTFGDVSQPSVSRQPAKPRRRGIRRWRRILNRRLEACQPKFSLQHMLLSWLGAFICIALLAYLTASTPYPFIAAPMGATAVLVFGVPDSPLAQPRNIIGGNLIAAIICVVCVALWGTAPWVMAIAVATTIKVTQLTRTVHPPAGAVALLGVLGNASWSYIITPILIGSVIMVICTYLFSMLRLEGLIPDTGFKLYERPTLSNCFLYF